MRNEGSDAKNSRVGEAKGSLAMTPVYSFFNTLLVNQRLPGIHKAPRKRKKKVLPVEWVLCEPSHLSSPRGCRGDPLGRPYHHHWRIMFIKILQIIAVVATILTGLVSLVNPRGVEGFTGLTVPGARGPLCL